jgi:hypothetical protein
MAKEIHLKDVCSRRRKGCIIDPSSDLSFWYSGDYDLHDVSGSLEAYSPPMEAFSFRSETEIFCLDLNYNRYNKEYFL